LYNDLIFQTIALSVKKAKLSSLHLQKRKRKKIEDVCDEELGLAAGQD